MNVRRTAKKGFTLVEILIVVIILGILAAIVIPQFTNASQDARRSSVASVVQTVRSQIELFKLQHGDQLPNIVGNDPAGAHWAELTTVTQFGTPAQDFGPYMQSAPSNGLAGGSPVVIDAPDGTTATNTDGFVYDY